MQKVLHWPLGTRTCHLLGGKEAMGWLKVNQLDRSHNITEEDTGHWRAVLPGGVCKKCKTCFDKRNKRKIRWKCHNSWFGPKCRRQEYPEKSHLQNVQQNLQTNSKEAGKATWGKNRMNQLKGRKRQDNMYRGWWDKVENHQNKWYQGSKKELKMWRNRP